MAERRNKEVCKCKDQTAYAALYLDDEQTDTFVHATCRLPAILVWEGNIKVCPGCLSEHSAPPWQEGCRDCHDFLVEEGEATGRFLGWSESGAALPSWQRAESQNFSVKTP